MRMLLIYHVLFIRIMLLCSYHHVRYLFTIPKCYILLVTSRSIIEKVHLDDLNVYLDTLDT